MNKSMNAICVSIGVVALLCSSTLSAATVTKLSDDAFAPLRDRGVTKKIILDKLPMYDAKRSVIELEEFELWAADGKVIVHGDNGVVLQTLPPPAMRYFRGTVNGDPESFAYFSTDAAGRNVSALIVTRDKKYSIATQHRPHRGAGERAGVTADTFMTTFDDDDVAATVTDQQWACDVDKIHPSRTGSRLHATGLHGLPIVENGITGTQAYAIKVDIFTDFELYQDAGSPAPPYTNLVDYIANLTGAASTIYNRDIHTNITQGNVHIYTTASDPWTATTSSTGLREIGDFIHANPTTASNVVFLSGKSYPGGIAWEAVACGTEFLCSGGNCGSAFYDGHYGGPYAWCGGVGNLGTMGLGSIPDVTTAPYGMPTGTQNYWPLAEYTHELGHNLAGHHTQCVVISSGEFAGAGFTDGTVEGAGTDFVDHCYGHDGAGCYGGAGGTTDYVAGSPGVHKGTIMSYCHNVFVSGVPQSRFTFGQAGEPSHHELDDYMYNASGPIGGGDNIRNAVGLFTISGITAPASVGANSTLNAASITAVGGSTYDWTITGGVITSGAASNSILFTADASGNVVLRVTAYGTNHCGVTDTATIPIIAACSYTLSTNTATFSKSATTGVLRVTTTGGCSWSATANTGFLAVTGGTPGNGTGNIVYTVAANATGARRTGTITVAGQTLTVTQLAEAQVGDTDGNGKGEIVWRNSSSGQSSVWLMDGASPQAGSGLTNLQFVNNSYILAGVGDFNGDGKADLIWRNDTTTGDTFVWMMNGINATTASGQLASVPPPWHIVGIGDFNGDGNADLLWRNGSSGINTIWLMNGVTVNPASGTVNQISDLNWHVGGVGDFDGDGKSDILWRNDVTGQSTIWFMNGINISGSSGLTSLQINTSWRAAGVGDFNGDGYADVMWHNPSTGENILWLMNGLSVIAGSGNVQQVADTNWNMVAFSDFNGDGMCDVVWRNDTTGDTSMWLMNSTTVGLGSGVLGTIAPPWQVAGPK